MAGTGSAHLRDTDAALLRVSDLTVEYRTKHGVVKALSGVSLDVLPSETVGIVGESGCGKSTLGRAVLNLRTPRSGSVSFRGVELTGLNRRAMRPYRRRLQMIFQDPISSMNPRRRVGDSIAEPLRIAGDTGDVRSRVVEMMEAVGLNPNDANRRPHEFSGGEGQRISIARALVVRPELVVCDEPVSALDVSVQAQILNLLEDLKEQFGLSYVFISHDLAAVRNISDRVVVMYLGKVCEVAPVDDLFQAPAHPYSRLLLDSIPRRDRSAAPAPPIAAERPSPLNPPSGCRFRTRCPHAVERCAVEEPVMRPTGAGSFVACHRAEETTSAVALTSISA